MRNYIKTLKDTYESQKRGIFFNKDATPGIAYIVKEPIEGILIASGILKLKINEEEIDKEYLAFVYKLYSWEVASRKR